MFSLLQTQRLLQDASSSQSKISHYCTADAQNCETDLDNTIDLSFLKLEPSTKDKSSALLQLFLEFNFKRYLLSNKKLQCGQRIKFSATIFSQFGHFISFPTRSALSTRGAFANPFPARRR